MTDFIREPAAGDPAGADNRSEDGGLLGGVSEREVERELLKERAAIMVKRGGCSFVKKSLNI